MSTKKYLDYAGLKRVLAKLLPGARKIWHGTLAEWEALSETERDKYDQAEVIDAVDVSWHPHPDWSKIITIAATQLVAGYTAPDDGMFIGFVCGDVTNGDTILLINNVLAGRGYRKSGDSASYAQIQTPVNKGDVLKAVKPDGGNLGVVEMCFVPWKA